MHRMKINFVVCLAVTMIMGCASLKDVQRAGELIRTDNELESLLRDKAPLSAEKTEQILVLGHFAKKEADMLATENQEPKIRDAISYYRIAATAFWKSQSKDISSDLLNSVDGGLDLCRKLGDRAPDRDEMYLHLVTHYAIYDEIFRSKTDIKQKLIKVNFDDADNTEQEIKLMKIVGDILIRMKNPIDKMLLFGADKRYKTHEGMRKYFCKNLSKAKDNYDILYTLYKVRVIQYHSSSYILDKTRLPSLNEVGSIKFVIEKPQYCQ